MKKVDFNQGIPMRLRIRLNKGVLLFILGLVFSFSEMSAQNVYDDMNQSWNFTQMLESSTSGGGSMSIDITNDILKVYFSAGFSNSKLKSGVVATFSTSPSLPDLELGFLNLNGGSYPDKVKVLIVSNAIMFEHVDGHNNRYYSSVSTTEFTVDLNPDTGGGNTSDDELNWVKSMTTDIKGKVTSSSKSYFDKLGRNIQSQQLDVKTNRIWASQSLYDSQGRPAISTMSAPINDTGIFDFKDNFMLNNLGLEYSEPEYESDIENPSKVGAFPGSLGWYYSENNTDEAYQDVTSYPFTRTLYSELNPGTIRKVIGGSKIDGEWKAGYTFSMPAGQELSASVAFGDAKYNSYKVIKTVSKGVMGVENVVFTDTDGKVLATARSGNEDPNRTIDNTRTSEITIGEQGYVDVHIPVGRFGLTIAGSAAIKIHGLRSDNEWTNSTSFIPNGFYRISVVDLENYTTNSITVTYPENYYDYSLNEYDKAGRLVKSYQPVGETKATKPVSTYSYNSLGQLTKVTSPDEGESNFKYRKDGQIRFSQNSKQLVAGEYSYTDYDELSRPIESGVARGIFGSLDPDSMTELPNKVTEEKQSTFYDKSGVATRSDFVALMTSMGLQGYYKQTFLAGNVVATQSNNNITWYSYDIYGRVKWMVQHIVGLGTKTIDYEYDPVTSAVTKVDFQRYTASERFIHKYSYDPDTNQLTKVETSTNDISYTLQAKYGYYETGALKWVELANGLQKIDYVYNINGQLKAINHPELTSGKDPSGNTNDVFGMHFNYYEGDYMRTGTNVPTTATGIDQLNGNIKSVSWNTQGLANSNVDTYYYKYNKNNWLEGASFNTSISEGSSISSLGAYNVYGLTYDANGNIQDLNRNKDASGGVGMDKLTYHYDDSQKPNKLTSVSDTEGNKGVGDIGSQISNNYTYNIIGQLTHDSSDNLEYLYNAQGLVKEIKQSGQPMLKLYYDDRGFRIRKERYSSGSPISNDYYVRDASGNVMAIYTETTQNELPIYGASRLGVHMKTMNETYYQVADHLGNVRAVIKKSNNAVTTAADYYPFGMKMVGNRNIKGSEKYRYGYQGEFAETDEETDKPAFQLRLWDSRIGRWLTADPYGQYASPYLGMGNDPINGIDPDGGYRTWIGAAMGWIGGGFKGKIDNPGLGGNKNYAISTIGPGGDGFAFTVKRDYGSNFYVKFDAGLGLGPQLGFDFKLLGAKAALSGHYNVTQANMIDVGYSSKKGLYGDRHDPLSYNNLTSGWSAGVPFYGQSREYYPSRGEYIPKIYDGQLKSKTNSIPVWGDTVESFDTSGSLTKVTRSWGLGQDVKLLIIGFHWNLEFGYEENRQNN